MNADPRQRSRRYCPDCYRLAHDGACEQLAFPGWRYTDIPTTPTPPAKPVTDVEVNGGLL